MRLYHVTPRRNMASICREGISPAYAKGKRRECWYVTYANLMWARNHVMKKYGIQVPDVIAYEVLIAPEKVTKRKTGIYTCFEVVNPIFIVDGLVWGSQYLETFPFVRHEGPMGA